MIKVLITGSVLGALQESVNFYKKLIEDIKCNVDDVQILSPLDTMAFTGNVEQRYLRAQQSVTDADIIIAEVSSPSHGQGMELMLAKLQNKEVVFICKKDCKVSGLIQGAFANSLFIDYTSYPNAAKLNKIYQAIINVKPVTTDN